MRTIDADVLKAAFETDGYLSPYMQRMIDACPTVGEWISVKDRLPEIGASYLVVVKEKYPYEAKWNIHVDVAASHGKYIDDFWDTFNDWDEGNEVHVTHWMPLPEPPKEDAE